MKKKDVRMFDRLKNEHVKGLNFEVEYSDDRDTANVYIIDKGLIAGKALGCSSYDDFRDWCEEENPDAWGGLTFFLP